MMKSCDGAKTAQLKDSVSEANMKTMSSCQSKLVTLSNVLQYLSSSKACSKRQVGHFKASFQLVFKTKEKKTLLPMFPKPQPTLLTKTQLMLISFFDFFTNNRPTGFSFLWSLFLLFSSIFFFMSSRN